MRAFLETLTHISEINVATAAIEGGGCPLALTGLAQIHRAEIGAAIANATERPAVFLCGDEREAHQLAADLETLTGKAPVTLLSREWQFRTGAVSSRSWEQERLAALYALSSGRTTPWVVATADGLIMRTLPKSLLKKSVIHLSCGKRVDLDEVTQRLTAMGYRRGDQVEGVGQFALRGGILDVFSPLMEQPVRVEFFDDEIDAMGQFDPITQRRVKNVKSVRLLPAAEVLPAAGKDGAEGLAQQLRDTAKRFSRRKLSETIIETLLADAERLEQGMALEGADRYLAAVYPEGSSGMDYLPADAVVFLCDSGRITERIKSTLEQVKQDTEVLMERGLMPGDYAKLTLSADEWTKKLSDFPVVMADSLPTSRYPFKPRNLLSVTAKQLASYGGSLDTAIADLTQYREAGSAVLVCCGNLPRAKNLIRLLEERDIPAVPDYELKEMPAPGEVRIAIGNLSAGSEYPQLKLVVLTEGQLLSSPHKRAKQRLAKDSSRQKIQSYTDLSPGDLVIHTHHGLGQFTGIQKMPVDGVQKDYMKIDYAGGDCLYVPATQLDLVSKYIGSGGTDAPKKKLNKLGGTEWSKTKYRAKAAAKDLAKGLIALYAKRARQPGFAFSPDSVWQREFEEAFDYEETPDQLRAIAEIKADMERPRPMDRLLCGDVGYGKTEVALRAVMKCVLDGKQAAILVPTTVLAQQHYATTIARFRNYPVTIETLSRYTTPKESKRILADLRAGKVDLIVGTHKLLQKNVVFHDLGLLVIDEEQRFGVTHKERLRTMARQVDTLTLTATPIPRTLNMALSGLRDMSSLEEPPQNRQPVQTYVLEHDWGILEDAMRKELARDGQVYYLHNRVDSIDLTASRIHKMLGEDIRIVVGHGKMREPELSRAMQQMVDGEADVFVCTTIIETGIDIPNVNTLIIEDADHMGLAQLHQIRGRIGRSSRRAYAYMTFRKGKILQETAAKRLAAIREYVEFGSGFKIAMRDLEIRGAGNLLGPEQSGYMMSVGYDMYLKLLEEAVLEEKGERKMAAEDCTADLTVNANIPESYVPSPEQRMDLYRRMAALRNEEESSDLLDELLDRYGNPPKPVLALLDVALLRVAAAKIGASDITQKGNQLKLKCQDIDPRALVTVCGLAKYYRRLTVNGGESPGLTLKLLPKDDVLQTALTLVEDLALAADSEKTEI